MSIDFPSEDSPLNTPTNTVVVEFIRCCTVLWKGYKLKLLPVPSYAVGKGCSASHDNGPYWVESVSAGGYDGLIVGEATGIKVGAKVVTTAVGGRILR
jgi:hypothetical protein